MARHWKFMVMGHKRSIFYIYIDDLVSAVLLASKVRNIGGETFQIATSKETTVDEMAEILVKALSDAGLKKLRITKAHQPSQNYQRTDWPLAIP